MAYNATLKIYNEYFCIIRLMSDGPRKSKANTVLWLFQKCKGFLQDTIINFRDNLEEEILTRAENEALESDLMLCLGTTLMVTPANRLVKKGKRPLRLVICNRSVVTQKFYAMILNERLHSIQLA